jgi:hypothetical protein
MLTPAVAPPAFDLEASKETIKKIEHLRPKTVCFSQYGPHPDAIHVIQESPRLLDHHYEIIRNMMKQGLSTEEMINAMIMDTVEERWGGKEAAHSMLTSIVLGFVSYHHRVMKKETDHE